MKCADAGRHGIDVGGGQAGVHGQRQHFVAGPIPLGTVYRMLRGQGRLAGNGHRVVHERLDAVRGEMRLQRGALPAADDEQVIHVAGVELARHDVTVNGVAPGWVDTEMCAEPFANGGKERIAGTIPVGRIASADDVAFPTVSLCFDGARHVTGEIVNVNGGSVLCG